MSLPLRAGLSEGRPVKILDRYVLLEALQVLMVGSLSILGIFFGTVECQNIINMLNIYGLPVNTVLSVMLLQLPTGMTYCLPAGVLVATIFIMIRQQNDSEILALQICGVSLFRRLAPYIVFAWLGAACVFFTNEYIAPQSKSLSEKLFLIGIYKTSSPFIGRSSIDFRNELGHIQQCFVFGKVVERTISGFLFFDLTETGIVKMIWANRAHWSEGNWKLDSGRVFDFFSPRDGEVRGSFETMRFGGNKDLVKQIEAGSISNLGKTTSELQKEIERFRMKKQAAPGELQLQYHRRLAHPVSCVLLVLAAAPIGLITSRNRKTLNLMYAGLLVLLYFVLQQLCMSLACNDRIDPIIGAWLPGAVLCAFGLTLCVCLRER